MKKEINRKYYKHKTNHVHTHVGFFFVRYRDEPPEENKDISMKQHRDFSKIKFSMQCMSIIDSQLLYREMQKGKNVVLYYDLISLNGPHDEIILEKYLPFFSCNMKQILCCKISQHL